jgi:hypothetical protein
MSNGSASTELPQVTPSVATPHIASKDEAAVDLHKVTELADGPINGVRGSVERRPSNISPTSSSATATATTGVDATARDDYGRLTPGTPGTGTMTPVGGKVGLSEVELMKRRRLLDAHMFE